MRNRVGKTIDDSLDKKDNAIDFQQPSRSTFLVCYLYMASGWIGGLLLVYLIGSAFPMVPTVYVDTPINRLLLLIRLQVIPASLFWFSTALAVKARLDSRIGAVDPIVADSVDNEAMTRLSIHNRVIRNHLEQYAFMLPSSLACATYLDDNPSSTMRYLIAAVCLWTLGRALFWLGYMDVFGTRRERIVGVSGAFHIAEVMWAYTVYRLANDMLFVYK